MHRISIINLESLACYLKLQMLKQPSSLRTTKHTDKGEPPPPELTIFGDISISGLMTLIERRGTLGLMFIAKR